MNCKNQLFAKSIKITLLFICAIAIFGEAYASDKYSIVEGQYIVILKEREFMRDLNISKAGESVKKIADRLINTAKQNQILVDSENGVLRSASNADTVNNLRVTYQYAIKGFSAALTEQSVQFLKNKPEVDYIEQDVYISVSAIQAPTPSWGIDRIDQRDLPVDQSYQYDTDGSNVHVYIIDTGIRTTHTEFTNRIGNGFDAVDNDYDATDCRGHGTHVAATAGGTSFGVAKNAVMHPVRVLNCSGGGSYSDVISGVDWVQANHQSPAVVNMSLGGPISIALDSAINNAINSGIPFVVSAGNNSSDACNQSPARVANAITVASSTLSDQRSYFSNIGTCVDIFAPGSSITSAWNSSDTATNTISGTSMSAPHVTGVVALYLEENFSASPAEVANSIIANSTLYRIGDAGYGTPNRLLFNRGSKPPVTIPTTHYLPWLISSILIVL